MIVTYLVFLAIGRIVVFYGQTFPLEHLPIIGPLFSEGRFFGKLVRCDLCFGFWVFLALAFLFPVNALSPIVEMPILREILTAMVSSFVVHLLRLGWDSKFGIILA